MADVHDILWNALAQEHKSEMPITFGESRPQTRRAWELFWLDELEAFRQALLPVSTRLGIIWYSDHAHLVLWDSHGPSLGYTDWLLDVDPRKIPGVVLVGTWMPDGVRWRTPTGVPMSVADAEPLGFRIADMVTRHQTVPVAVAPGQRWRVLRQHPARLLRWGLQTMGLSALFTGLTLLFTGVWYWWVFGGAVSFFAASHVIHYALNPVSYPYHLL